MSNLNELIVYFWLIPVSVQILLPMAVLGFWLMTRVPASLMNKSAASEAAAKPSPA